MHEVAAQVWRLLAEADRLPLSAAKLAVLQEAVHLADAHNEIDLAIEARRPLMFVARNLLRGDILTAAFTWCLAHYDREPQRFGGRDLFWEYRMVIGQLANLADVPRTKLQELLDDFGRRLQAAGRSLAPLYDTQRSIAADLGDRAMAIAANEAIRRHRLTPGGDLVGDRFDDIETALFLGDEERALQLAEPLLRRNRPLDRPGSETAYAGLLLPLWKRKRLADAVRLEKRCARACRPEHYYYWWYGDLLKWLTLTNQLGRAVPLYEACQRAMNSYTDPLTRLHFVLDALVLFERLHRQGRRTLAARLPELVPVPSIDGLYDVEELDAWLHREARELAEGFDARNGNDYFRQQIQERLELSREADVNEFPLTPADGL
ncbi:MAG TPA: hypothetical protein VH575_22585 [Gemmataceae bacterium]